MNDKPNKPKYYRLLEKGEIIKKGDYVFENINLFKEVSISIGCQSNGIAYFRPITVDPWISYAEQKPTKEDFEPTGVIHGINKIGECWHYGNSGDSQKWTDRHIMYWRRITPPQPAKPKSVEVKIRNTRSGIVAVGNFHGTLTLNADGTADLGCGDVISAESINEFIKARDEVMRK